MLHDADAAALDSSAATVTETSAYDPDTSAFLPLLTEAPLSARINADILTVDVDSPRSVHPSSAGNILTIDVDSPPFVNPSSAGGNPDSTLSTPAKSDASSDDMSDFERFRGPYLCVDDLESHSDAGLSDVSSQPEKVGHPSSGECWIVTPPPCFTLSSTGGGERRRRAMVNAASAASRAGTLSLKLTLCIFVVIVYCISYIIYNDIYLCII